MDYDILPIGDLINANEYTLRSPVLSELDGILRGDMWNILMFGISEIEWKELESSGRMHIPDEVWQELVEHLPLPLIERLAVSFPYRLEYASILGKLEHLKYVSLADNHFDDAESVASLVHAWQSNSSITHVSGYALFHEAVDGFVVALPRVDRRMYFSSENDYWMDRDYTTAGRGTGCCQSQQ